MIGAARMLLVGGSCVVLGTVLCAGMLDLPSFGSDVAAYGLLLAEIALTERQVVNTVSGVLFDLRSLDTLGELTALFAASAGLHVVLRRLRGERTRPTPRVATNAGRAVRVSTAIRSMSLALVAPVAGYGLFITLRGHLTAGGGFQGGVIVVAALLLVYLAGRVELQEKIADDRRLDIAESAALGGYVLLGLAGLFAAGTFFANVLPLGSAGALWSAGIIVPLGLLVAVDAAAAATLLVSHLQHETREREGGP